MKKLLLFILSLFVCFSLAACKPKTNQPVDPGNTDNPGNTENPNTPDDDSS